MNWPCKDCTDRVPGCHASCEKYAAETNKKNEWNRRQQKESDVNAILYGDHLDRMNRYQRAMKKRYQIK